jgi:hypothetical protein
MIITFKLNSMNFKNKLVLLVFVCLTSTTLSAQVSNVNNVIHKEPSTSLNLTGEIPGLEENELVTIYMYEFSNFDGRMNWIPIDTAIVKKGKFFFDYQLKEGPRLFMFTFSKHSKNLLSALLGNENVRLTSKLSIDDIPPYSPFLYYRFEGSDATNDFIYSRGIKTLWGRSIAGINAEIKSYNDSATLSRSSLENIWTLIKARAAINNAVGTQLTGSLYTRRSTAICEIFTETAINYSQKYDSLWYRVYQNLDEDIKESYYGKIVKSYLPIMVGQAAPDFSLVTKDGKANTFKKILQQKKLTLLYLWSENSSPDTRYKFNEELTKHYKKYFPKGLEIVNVYLGANQSKWKKLVAEEKVPGSHTIDVDGEIANRYRIEKNDMYTLLVDQSGKIIAWEVYGAELSGYLYKILGE